VVELLEMKSIEKTLCENILEISHFEENTTLLGPLSRFVIWVYGCCFDCDGCMAERSRRGAKKNVNIQELSELILSSNAEGITISGGEPFLQSKALSELIFSVRNKKDIGVIVYSGYTLEEIEKNDEFKELLSSIDLLIDGRYEKELDDGRAYVGSSNQVLHYLTDRYAETGKAYYSADKRRAEIKLTPDHAFLIGVPSAGVLKAWKEILQKAGGTIYDF